MKTSKLDRLVLAMKAAQERVAQEVSNQFPIGALVVYDAGRGRSVGIVKHAPDAWYDPQQIVVENRNTGRGRRVHVRAHNVQVIRVHRVAELDRNPKSEGAR